MKKIVKFYRNNRIYCILMLVSLICLISIGTGVVVYFVDQATSDKYGNRLEDIDNYDVKDDLDKMSAYFKDTKGVESSNVRLQGKIIYCDIEVKKDMKNSEVESIATKSLDNISDDNKSFYDIQFIFKRDNLNPYMGSKSSSKSIISWTNYSFDTEDKGEKK